MVSFLKVTIYDIAEKAGVSIATVSKVINNKGRISVETRENVLAVMKELNYRPSIIATALTGKNTNTLGLLIPDLANPFFAELARSIEDSAKDLDYNVVICNTDYSSIKESEYIDLLIQKQVDGFILASGFEQMNPVETLIERNIPVVIVARELPDFEVMSVANDDYYGGYLAAQHLVKQGHQHIGILGRDLWSNRERMRGFNTYLEEQEMPLWPNFKYIEGVEHVEEAIKETRRLLSDEKRPTAIFACNDLLAAGAIRAARDLGFEIPEDLAIVGYDDTSIATIVQPTLTSVAQPIPEIGAACISLIANKIQGIPVQNKNVKFNPTLMIRQST